MNEPCCELRQTADVVVMRVSGHRHRLSPHYRQERPQSGDPGTAVDDKIPALAPDEVHVSLDKRVHRRFMQTRDPLAYILSHEPVFNLGKIHDTNLRSNPQRPAS